MKLQLIRIKLTTNIIYTLYTLYYIISIYYIMHARAAGREWGERKGKRKSLQAPQGMQDFFISLSPSLCHMIIAKFLHQSAKLYKVLFFLDRASLLMIQQTFLHCLFSRIHRIRIKNVSKLSQETKANTNYILHYYCISYYSNYRA